MPSSIVPYPLITVSGLASGVGKTTLAEWLIRRLAPIAALKVTVVDSGVDGCPILRACGVCSSLRVPYRILVEHPLPGPHERGLDAPRKDTERLAWAGADPVVWVQTRGEFLDAALEAGLARVGRGGVVIEGNSVVQRLRPDLALMVDRAGRTESKPSAQAILSRMHAVLINSPQRVPGVRRSGPRCKPEAPGVPHQAFDFRAPGRRGESILDRLLARAMASGEGVGASPEAKSGRGC